VLEVNPRASRTVPYVCKATGQSVARIATKVMAGMRLADLGFTRETRVPHFAVKEAVLPFIKFPGALVALGPEMRSTGEVMGIDMNYGLAFLKSQEAAGGAIPRSGGVFISVNDHDKPEIVDIAAAFAELGFTIYATGGTHGYLKERGIASEMVFKVNEGRPNVVDMMIERKIHLVFNTPLGQTSKADERAIRSNAVSRNIPLLTTVAAARAVVEGLQASRSFQPTIKALQDYHRDIQRQTLRAASPPAPVAEPRKPGGRKGKSDQSDLSDQSDPSDPSDPPERSKHNDQ
jgi:carbamoyl-phosphate synthase large subunit